VGDSLGLDATAAAHGIFRLVNANMANAIRRVTSQAGLDPRHLRLIVYGGNGPVHAGKQAEELGIRRILVPKTSPAFSALGLLIADRVIDVQRSHIAAAKDVSLEVLTALFDELTERAREDLATAGVARSDARIERFLQICYPGQTFDLSVPCGAGDRPLVPQDLTRAIGAFHDLHEEQHAYAVRTEEPIIRGVRLVATGGGVESRLPRFEKSGTTAGDALAGRRRAYFDGRFVEVPVYDGERVRTGQRLEGPAIIEERFTTVVLYPGHKAELDEHGNYDIAVP
jgi:N-methylhydantoinase A